MGDLRLGNHDYSLVSVNGSIANSWREEDASPTAVQAAENAPDAANVPVARTEYTNFGGSVGLDERTQAPGDYNRFWVSDWDATRPGQVTSWVRWPGDTVTISGGTGPTIPGLLPTNYSDAYATNMALIPNPQAPGFVTTAGVYGAATGKMYLWNGTTFVFQKTTTNAPNAPDDLFYGASVGSYFLPHSRPVVTADGGQWMADLASGFTDLIANVHSGTAPLGDWILPFYDFVAVIGSGSQGTIQVRGYKPAWTSLQTQTITASATASNAAIGAGTTSIFTIGNIQDTQAIVGAVACEGVLWLATMNTLYGIQWNDSYNTWKIEQLFQVPRITGPPVDWNAEVYIPCGNRLAHVIPGQKGYDWRKIDQFDTMPPPFNGRIVECVASPDALYCRVVEESTTSVRACIMRLDTSGAWSCVYVDQATNSTLARMPLVRTADAKNPPSIGYFTGQTTIRLIPTQDSGRNPRTMAVAAREQRAQVRGISPWETGVSSTNQKQLLRYRIEVEDCAVQSIKVYYQFPVDAYVGATDTFTTGAAAYTGTWHPCGVITANTTGYRGGIDANGNGWVEVEFDNATSYPGGVGLLPEYPDFLKVRFCIEINGDTTGAHVPTLRSFSFDREEYISKTKVITANIDLSLSDPARGGLDYDPQATDTVRDAAWVQNELAYIESMVVGKRAQPLVSPKINPATGTNYTYKVEVTKWQEILQDLTDEGQVGARVQLTMKVIPLLGTI